MPCKTIINFVFNQVDDDHTVSRYPTFNLQKEIFDRMSSSESLRIAVLKRNSLCGDSPRRGRMGIGCTAGQKRTELPLGSTQWIKSRISRAAIHLILIVRFQRFNLGFPVGCIACK